MDDEDLLCNICQTPTDDLRLLSCTHFYCLECLQDWAKQKQNKDGLVCPECRQVTDLPDKGVSGLSSGISLRVARELMSRSGSQKTACQFCKNEDISAYCKQCRKNLCQACAEQHLSREVFADHRLQPASRKCLKHEGDPLEFYCQTCRVALCVICTHEHEHEPIPMTLARKQVASKLLKSTAEIVPKVEKLRDVERLLTDNLKGYKEMVNADHTNAKDTVQRISDDAVARIFEWEQNTYAAIQQSLSSKLDSYKKAVDDLSDIPEEFDELQADHLLLAGDKYGNLVENYEKLYSQYSDYTPKTIKFEQNMEFLNQTVGEVIDIDVDKDKIKAFLGNMDKRTPWSRESHKTRNQSTRQASGNDGGVLQEINHTQKVAAMTFTSDQTIYISDPNNKKLLHIEQSGEKKNVPIEDCRPYGLAVATNGTLYTCDRNQKKLFLYHPSWDEILFRERLELKHPIGVGMLTDGNVVVSDSSTCKIYTYGKEGKLLKSFGGPGTKKTQFSEPGYLTVDCHNNILIADQKAKAIKVWSHNGVYIKSIKLLHDQSFYQYQSFTTDSLANILVANKRDNVVEKISPDGQLIEKLEWPFLTGPCALAMGSNGKLAISQTGETRNAISIVKLY